MNTNQQQVTSLAAIVQVATLVEKLARTGDISSKDSNMLLQAIFVQSPQRFEDIYNHDKQELSLGLSNLEIILGQSTVRISPDIARYTLSLLHLENKLRKQDRKSTRLNSSHVRISYAVFCLKKKSDSHPDGRRFSSLLSNDVYVAGN